MLNKNNTSARMIEIEKLISNRLVLEGLEDTPENRICMLHKQRDFWLDEVLVPEDMDRYLIAIEIMISKATYAYMFPKR